MNNISKDNPIFYNYLEMIKGKVYKILPLLEENNDGIYHYIDSLLFELYGVQYVISGVENSFNYVSILCRLESILDELIVKEKDFKFIRSEIFKMIRLVENLQKGE